MRTTILLVCLLLTGGLSAQTIRLDFPHFAGKEYAFWLFAGDSKDTIATGRLDRQGKATLTIPARYKNYRGISQWMLNEGGGLDMMISGENFSVSCSEATPDNENIMYSDSPENDFLNTRYKRQKEVLAKINAISIVEAMYNKDDKLFPILNKELGQLQDLFQAQQAENRNSSLYAARFMEISDFLRGIGSRLYASETEYTKELSEFAADGMDFEALYTSNLWNDFFDSWIAMHLNVIKDDSLLLHDTKKMLLHINNKEIYTAFAEKVVSLYSKYGKDNLIEELSAELAGSGKLYNPGIYLRQLTLAAKGTMAPSLSGLEDNRFTGRQTLLVFYESGCGNCGHEMQRLKDKYALLQQKGIRLISISADKDDIVCRTYANSFPWADKLCSPEGRNSENFRNYGIIGTPTLIMVDKEGKIKGRYARLEDTGLSNNAEKDIDTAQ